ASRRALQQTLERSYRYLAIDGRAPASVVDPLVDASRSPPAQASPDVSARQRRCSSDAYVPTDDSDGLGNTRAAGERHHPEARKEGAELERGATSTNRCC